MELLIGGEFISYPSLIGQLKKGYPFRHQNGYVSFLGFRLCSKYLNLNHTHKHNDCPHQQAAYPAGHPVEGLMKEDRNGEVIFLTNIFIYVVSENVRHVKCFTLSNI